MAGSPNDPPTTLHENLVEFSPDALLVVDSAGTILLTNSTADAMFGFARDELLGATIERLIPERLRGNHERHRGEYLASPRKRGMGGTAIDLLAVRKDGTEFPVEIRLSPLQVNGDQVVAAAIRDVTDRRHTAQVLRAAQLESDRSSAAKSRFLATASHDLRQPLQALRLLNAALEEQLAATDLRQLVARQREALDAMSRLVNSLLDISKLEAGTIKPEFEDICVAEVFAALRDEFESLARARGLILEIETGPHYIRTDRTLFRQLLENLLGNALKYTEKGGVRLTSSARGEDLVIEVADTGIGIGAEHLGSIFDEYYQVSRKRHQGVGLGLSIVKHIAGLLGLSLDVSSEPARGTRFQVGIPAAQVCNMSLVLTAEAVQKHLTRPASPAVILLVEDDDAVRAATEFYLKTVGHKPISAPSIAAAESALETAAVPPDLIITDYHLSQEETGIHAVRRLRARAGRVLPALLLSGDTSAALREQAQAESCRILSKPVDVDALVETISELLQD